MSPATKSGENNSHSSRRSSILKPPKVRQPLQNINLNNSSTENSPATLKFKRRVSFAEKKHVKEFCSSLDQGTVWDNTYEEHDLSSLKITAASKEGEIFSENVKNDLQLNIATDNESRNLISIATNAEHIIDEKNVDKHIINQVASEEAGLAALVGHTEHLDVLQDKEVLSNEPPITDEDINPKEKQYVPISVYEDEDINLPAMVAFEPVAQNLETVCTSNLIETCNQAAPMELTEVVYSNVLVTPETKDISMDISPAVLPSINTYQLNSEQSNCIPCDSTTKTQQFNDISIELTAGVQSLKTQLPSKKQNTMDIPFDTSMEFTTMIPSAIIFAQSNPKICEGTQVFHNASMEMTTAISASTDVQHCDGETKASNVNTIRETERTMVFFNAPMEMTSVINPTKRLQNSESDAIMESPTTIGTAFNNERTELLNLSMEITQAINTYTSQRNGHCDSNNLNSNAIDSDEAMELTTAITASNIRNSDEVESVSDTTKVFQNNSMTFTMPLSSLTMEGEHKGGEYFNLDKATMSASTSMEFTEAVDNVCSEKDNLTANNTLTFDAPMEFTTAIPSLLRSHPILDKENCPIAITLRDCKTNQLGNSIFIEQIFSNNKASMPLHELAQQNTSASALDENNALLACAAIHLKSNNNITAVSSDHDQCPQLDDNTNCSEENAQHILRDIENQSNSTVDSIQHFIEKSFQLYNKGSKELESINPPSFVCLEDSLDCDSSANAPASNELEINQDFTKQKELVCEDNTNSENTLDLRCNSQNYNVIRDHQLSIMNDNLMNKSQTFVIKFKMAEENRNSTRIDYDESIEIPEVQTLQITAMCSNNKESQTVSCHSTALGNTFEQIPELQNDSHFEKLPELQLTCVADPQPKASCRLSTATDNCKGTESSISGAVQVEIATKKCENPSTDVAELNEEPRTIIEDKSIADVVETNHDARPLTMESSRISTLNLEAEDRNASMELGYFSVLVNKLKTCALSDDIIWEVYHENIERKIIVIGFISCSLLVVIFLSDDYDCETSNGIREIKIISRLADDAGTLISMILRIILERIDTEKLMCMYKSSEDILPMLNDVSVEVKLALDFMFNLKHLDDLNLMEISRDRVSIVCCTKRMDIILKITLNIKQFDRIEPCDVSVNCLLGSVREEEVKGLITNIKRDHKFVQTYVNDVKDYIYLMEECNAAVKQLE